MSQYGALGYANDGWTYDQILAHFYTGAELGPAPVARVRVLVAEARPSVTVSSTVPFRVRDLFGKTYPLAAGDVVLGPKLRVTVNGVPTELVGPILFLPGSSPLELDRDRAYRGQIEVGVTGQKLSVINSPRARAVPRRRRPSGDAERLARRGAEGAGRRRPLVCARAPPRRQGLRPLRRRPQPGLRRHPGRASRARPPRSRRPRARCCSGRASRSTRSSTRPRAGRRSPRWRCSARPCRTSSPSTIRTARSRR